MTSKIPDDCRTAFKNVFDGYGSFFGIDNNLSKALLMLATMLSPPVGTAGLSCALMVLAVRHMLSLPYAQIDVVNGLLLGMLLGSMYGPSPSTLALLAIGAIFVVLTGIMLGQLLRLPVLGLPYVISSYPLIVLASLLKLPPAVHSSLFNLPLWHYGFFENTIQALGTIYFSGTISGGALVFIAFLLASRYLAGIALLSSAAVTLFLAWPQYIAGTLPYLLVQMNVILAATVLGALYTKPGRASIAVALLAVLVTAVLSIFVERLLYQFALPPLALPFVLSVYFILLSLNYRGGQFAWLWLYAPKLPEAVMEELTQAEARGLSPKSVALHLPLSGTWQIYQGFNGEVTHQGLWCHALDFYQTREGLSFKNQGKELSDYFAYGKPILSPGFGYVVDYYGLERDNKPGKVNLVNTLGNYITVRLDNGYFVVLAHLQKDSIRVSLGARVVPGQVLALLGNSGRSPQPHLHMHVQSDLYFAATIPFHLTSVIAVKEENGKKVNHYSLSLRPGEGDTVQAPVRNAALRQALRFNVGQCFEYEWQGQVKKLEVTLDPTGQFYLKTNRGKAAFVLSEDLLACFARSGNDPFLDALLLSVGLTPLPEGTIAWQDRPAASTLPFSPLLKIISRLFSHPCLHSRYERYWDQDERLWIQRGEHSHRLAFINYRWQTEAKLCEQGGILSFSIITGTQRKTARLLRMGIRKDNGIPETMVEMQKLNR